MINNIENIGIKNDIMSHFNIYGRMNDTILRYGTAVSVGVFIGAALSSGTILGGLTWYAMSRNVLVNMMKPLRRIFPKLDISLLEGGEEQSTPTVTNENKTFEELNASLIRLQERVEKLENEKRPI